MNRFRNCVLMAAGFAVLALVVGVFSAGPAIAQAVRAALVLNVDDPGRIPYDVRGFCSITHASDSDCPAGPKVPAGKRLVITHVSGVVRGSLPGGTPIIASIMNSVSFDYLPVTYQGSALGFNYFQFGQPVLVVYDAGSTPTVALSLSTAPDPSAT